MHPADSVTPAAALPRIGFIGLGSMGLPLAQRLARAGYELVVCDREAHACQPLLDLGAVRAQTPQQTASDADVVFACLPTPTISEHVAFGDQGVVHADRMHTYIELSTIGAQTMARIAHALAEHGKSVLDAPVSGGPRGAAAGRLSCFVSAPAPAFERVEPVLKAMSDHLFRIGDTPGQSQVLKLANNLLNTANFTVACEMLLMAVRAGIAPEVALSVINVSTGRNRATEETLPQQILSGAYATGARLSILQKDVGLAVDEARALAVSHRAALAVRDIWDEAVAAGWGEKDLSEIYRFIDAQASR